MGVDTNQREEKKRESKCAVGRGKGGGRGRGATQLALEYHVNVIPNEAGTWHMVSK